ncbi:MAG: GDSL-type esterase/lipase family protein [Deltaproteobacteria bacterium]|nr:GDSL-type esterase/lipase family protein [Deltaproteobacteria bacterium]
MRPCLLGAPLFLGFCSLLVLLCGCGDGVFAQGLAKAEVDVSWSREIWLKGSLFEDGIKQREDVAPFVFGQEEPSLEEVYPRYPPPPLFYPLDASGAPIYGIEISIEDPSGHALSAWHRALRRAEREEGQARMVIFGASHVAPDIWPGMVRKILQQRFGDGGPGFVLPAPPWRGYHHEGLEIEGGREWKALRYRPQEGIGGRFGLAGVAIESEAPTWGRVRLIDAKATKFEFFFERRPDGGIFEVVLDGQLVGQVDTKSSTIENAYHTIYAEDGPHELVIQTIGNGRIKLFGVAIEREFPGVLVDAMGINGARAAWQLSWDEALFSEHLRKRAPDLVVLAYGTNESGDDHVPLSHYESDLRQVIERIKRAVPGASCLLVGLSDRPIILKNRIALPRQRTFDVIAVQRKLARIYGCGFFDLVAFGGGPLHILEWARAHPPWAQRDRVHFTRRGYERLGQVIAKALLERY